MRSSGTRPLQKNKDGFTLLELIVIILMVGVLSTLGLTTFSQQQKRERLRSSTNAMLDWLEERRRQAMTLQNVSESFTSIQNVTDKKSGACIISIDPANALFSTPSDAQVLNSQNSMQNVVNICLSEQPLRLRSISANNQDLLLTLLSGSSSGSDRLIFTFRGTVEAAREFKLSIPGLPTSRCIKVTAPLGLIRSGVADSSGSCNYRDDARYQV